MADDVQQLVNDILNEGGFDTDSATALRILNRRHRQMVARARAFKKSVTLGVTTTAGVTDYSVATAAGLVETVEITVNALTFGKGKHTDIAQGKQSQLTVAPDGVFMETADASGVQQISLFPAPDSSGQPIVIFGAYEPPDLTLDGSASGTLRVDSDALEGLLSGVWATYLSRPSEARLDLANTYEAAFGQACEEFRSRVKRRLRGPGPTQIRLQGVNA